MNHRILTIPTILFATLANSQDGNYPTIVFTSDRLACVASNAEKYFELSQEDQLLFNINSCPDTDAPLFQGLSKDIGESPSWNVVKDAERPHSIVAMSVDHFRCLLSIDVPEAAKLLAFERLDDGACKMEVIGD